MNHKTGALWLLIGLQASWGRTAEDLCQYQLSAINERCPHSSFRAIGLPNPNCQMHVRETIETCSRSIDAAQKAMKEAPNDEKYRAAADRYGRTLIAMGRLRTMDQPDIRSMQPLLDQAIRPRERWLAESLPPSKREKSQAKTDKPKEEAKAEGIAGKVGKQIGEGQRKGGETAGEAHDLLEAEKTAKEEAKRQEADRQEAQQRIEEGQKLETERRQIAEDREKQIDKNLKDLDPSFGDKDREKSGGSGAGPEKKQGGEDGQPTNKTGNVSGSGGPQGRSGGQLQSLASGGRGLGGGAANPKTGSDLLLASLGGYKNSFAGMGLKMGRGELGEPAVLRSDGTPASAAEVEGLKKLIAAEPQALQKRPDFFDVFPRGSFNTLKETYKEKPDAKAFKHMGVPERRDFEWNKSCEKVSGACNEYTRQSSYRKGDYVSPEDLWTISTVLGGKDAGEKGGSSADLAREKLARGPYANLMKNVLGALGGIMKAVKGGGSSSSSGSMVWGGGGSWSWNWGAREPVELTDPARVKRGQGTMPGHPVNLPDPQKTFRGGLWRLLTAAGAVSFGIWIVKRRREQSASKPPEEDSGAG